MSLGISQYKIMWILVLFDLPTETKRERKAYSQFRKELLKDGFSMFQFSIYLRHCSSRENRDVHINRVKKIMPEKGNIGILSITDKQFEMLEIYDGRKKADGFIEPHQLELF